MSSEYWIKTLELLPHPEGGYFKETYRATERIPQSAMPQRFAGERSFSTAIYYLLRSGDFSAFHRIAADELWHFYAGSGLDVHVIDASGTHSVLKLGTDVSKGRTPQGVVPHGSWFAAEVASENSYALVGCTVAPGFEFADFEMAKRDALARDFPAHAALIARLTRA